MEGIFHGAAATAVMSAPEDRQFEERSDVALSKKKSSTSVHRAEASVELGSVEALLCSSQLGQRIRRLRLKKSMGLVELGRLTGLSASFLSQLETGRVVPTLRNLARLALVFERDISFFFQSPDQSVFRIQRSKDRVRLKMGAPSVDYIAESFGILIPEGGVRPCLAEFLPGDEHSFQPDTSAGVELVYVTQGSVSLLRNGVTYELEERDVCYIGSETHRVYRCSGDRPAKAMIISFDGEPTSASKNVRRQQDSPEALAA